jgi:hypothetical protein
MQCRWAPFSVRSLAVDLAREADLIANAVGGQRAIAQSRAGSADFSNPRDGARSAHPECLERVGLALRFPRTQRTGIYRAVASCHAI